MVVKVKSPRQRVYIPLCHNLLKGARVFDKDNSVISERTMSDCVYNDSDDDAVQSKESGTRLFELSMSSQQEISIAPSSKDSRFEIGYASEQVGEYTCTPKSDSPMSSSSIDYKVPVRSGMHTPHKSYTLQYKLSVLDWYHSHGENKKQTAKHFGVDRKRIRDWLRLEQQFRLEPKSNMQRKRNTTGCPPHYQELDKTVLEWYKEQEVQGRKVTNRALRTKALELAPQMGYEDTFKASSNWAVAWRRRNKDVLMETSTLSDNTELATELEEELQQDGVNSKSNVVETITGVRVNCDVLHLEQAIDMRGRVYVRILQTRALIADN